MIGQRLKPGQQEIGKPEDSSDELKLGPVMMLKADNLMTEGSPRSVTEDIKNTKSADQVKFAAFAVIVESFSSFDT